MMKYILFILTVFLFASCANQPLIITDSENPPKIIGGNEALLNDIVYPDYALQKGIEGVVTVLAYVDTNGNVKNCRIIEGNEFLNDAAVSAIKKQRFEAYRIKGKKHAVRVAIPIVFTISKDINIREYEKDRVMDAAQRSFDEAVQTLTAFPAVRSAGSLQAYYSEGKSWWPKADDPEAAYVYLDNTSNPDAFRLHADALAELGEIVPGLTVAYLISRKEIYAQRAVEHLKAWFIDEATRMEPHLHYAQAIPNRTAGRDVGIYEGLHFVEIARAIPYLALLLSAEEEKALKQWFREYADFLMNNPFGISARARINTYGTAWLLQITVIGDFLEDESLRESAKQYFQTITLPNLVAVTSPVLQDDLNRTFTDNIFLNIDILTCLSQILSDKDYHPWEIKIATGETVDVAMRYLYSGILNNTLNTAGYYKGRFLSLLLAGKVYEQPEYLELWKKLQDDFNAENDFPLRQPLLWLK
ncbi:MAG: TonB family protein [Candidatus Marinimicrobia bacterium]|nr:TonB family protein [Candidatus Neomarinimicrobiota bacterium]